MIVEDVALDKEKCSKNKLIGISYIEEGKKEFEESKAFQEAFPSLSSIGEYTENDAFNIAVDAYENNLNVTVDMIEYWYIRAVGVPWSKGYLPTVFSKRNISGRNNKRNKAKGQKKVKFVRNNKKLSSKEGLRERKLKANAKKKENQQRELNNPKKLKEIDTDSKLLEDKEVVFKPTERQAKFLSASERIVLYGGSAGGIA
jgi:hypothetical protein